MKKYMILFSVGKDRPGIVDDVSTVLFEHEANIEDSRMAVMGGRFSVMTLFSCETDQLQAIKNSLQGLKELGLETSLHDAEEPTAVPGKAALPLKMEITAIDHPGIVQKAVRILRKHKVNVESLNTQVSRAPLSGAPLFNLNLEAAVPTDIPVSKIKEELSDLARDMNLGINFW
jgi:glycine cleavage system transcriptional repressor